jgi:hypothetical protein
MNAIAWRNGARSHHQNANRADAAFAGITDAVLRRAAALNRDGHASIGTRVPLWEPAQRNALVA